MKRYLLILFIIISLLVSCSSTQVKQPEVQSEPPVAEAPAAQEQAPETEEVEEADATPQEAPEAETPVEEEAAAEEQPVEEQEVIEEQQPAEAEAAEAVVEEDTSSDEQDWSQVIGSAPAEQAPQVQSEPEKEPETPAPEPEKEAPKAEKAPAQAPARTASFTDKIISLVKTVGNFISEQILLSIGIFVCFGGFVYLIAVLAISGKRERQKRPAPARKTVRENTSFEPGQDKEPETDDDFLKSLLGDDSN